MCRLGNRLYLASFPGHHPGFFTQVFTPFVLQEKKCWEGGQGYGYEAEYTSVYRS